VEPGREPLSRYRSYYQLRLALPEVGFLLHQYDERGESWT
jgi:hypothetical protein